jgi:hypothetical protein
MTKRKYSKNKFSKKKRYNKKKYTKKRYNKKKKYSRKKRGGSLTSYYSSHLGSEYYPSLVGDYAKPPMDDIEAGEAPREVLTSLNFDNGKYKCKINNMAYNPEEYKLETNGFQMFDLYAGDEERSELLCSEYAKNGGLNEESMEILKSLVIKRLKNNLGEYEISYGPLIYRDIDARGFGSKGRGPFPKVHLDFTAGDNNKIAYPFTNSSLDTFNNNLDLYNSNIYTNFEGYNEEDFDLLNVWFVIGGDQGKVSNSNLALLDYRYLRHDNFDFDYQNSINNYNYTEEINDKWYSHHPLKIGQGYVFYTNKTPHTAWINYSKQNLFGRKSLEMRVIARRIYANDEKKLADIASRTEKIQRWSEGFTPEQLQLIENLKKMEVYVISGEELRQDDLELYKLSEKEIEQMHGYLFGRGESKIWRYINIQRDIDYYLEEYKIDKITIIINSLVKTGKLGFNFHRDAKDYGKVSFIDEDSILKDHIKVGDKLSKVNEQSFNPKLIPKLRKIGPRPFKLVFTRELPLAPKEEQDYRKLFLDEKQKKAATKIQASQRGKAVRRAQKAAAEAAEAAVEPEAAAEADVEPEAETVQTLDQWRQEMIDKQETIPGAVDHSEEHNVGSGGTPVYTESSSSRGTFGQDSVDHELEINTSLVEELKRGIKKD